MSFSSLAFTVGCVVWLVFEIWLNLRDRAKIDATKGKSSGIYLFFLIIAALGICGIVQVSNLPRIPINHDLRFASGAIIIFAGAILRWWSVWYLGRYFRTVVAVQDGQRVVNRGPYRYIRHPSYTGAMIVFLGFGLGLGSWIGLAAMLVLPIIGYHRRIKLEEQLMITCFPKEYLNFIEETKKIIPFIY